MRAVAWFRGTKEMDLRGNQELGWERASDPG